MKVASSNDLQQRIMRSSRDSVTEQPRWQGDHGAPATAARKQSAFESGENLATAAIKAKENPAGSFPPRALVEVDGSPHIYRPMIELFRQGAPANDLFLIGHGLVKLTRLESNGREIIVDLRFPGWLLGAASVILQQPHAVSAITLTDCYLHRISAPDFQQLLKTDELVSMYIHEMHCREVQDKIRHVAQLACLTAGERLIHLLQRLTPEPTVGESKNEIRVQLPLKYWELAQLVAVTPEHLSRLVKRMQHKGILRQDKNWLTLTTEE